MVPNTGEVKGIKAAVAVGAVAGDADKELRGISSVEPERHEEVANYLIQNPVQVVCTDTPHIRDIRLMGQRGGQVLLSKTEETQTDEASADRSLLNLYDILLYAGQVPLEDVELLLERQTRCNSVIAQEGLDHSRGREHRLHHPEKYVSDIKVEAWVWGTAGSNAHMSGYEMQVGILSGSGNQGKTASLLVSNMVTVYQKVGIGRLAVPVIHDEANYKFEIGKGETLREGSDVALLATGLMTAEALEAAEALAAKGISARVINLCSIKPLDTELVLKAAAECGRIVTCEEHSVIGGLGEAVCAAIAEAGLPCKVKRIGVQDEFGHSGPAKELLKQFGLSAEKIARAAKELF